MTCFGFNPPTRSAALQNWARRQNPSGGFLASPFNFFVFPSESHGKDLLLSPSSAAFLARNGMDFTKWVAEGVPFVDRAGEAELERADCHRQERVEVSRQQDRELVEAALADLAQWIEARRGAPMEVEGAASHRAEAPPPVAEYLLPEVNAFLRRYLYQEIAARFPDAVTEKRTVEGARQPRIAVLLLSPDALAARRQAEAERKHAQLTMRR